MQNLNENIIHKYVENKLHLSETEPAFNWWISATNNQQVHN